MCVGVLRDVLTRNPVYGCVCARCPSPNLYASPPCLIGVCMFMCVLSLSFPHRRRVQDPFVVFSSNLFAIMGLRSIYVIIAQAVSQLPYLKPAVALVLGFVGCKMLLEYVHFKISTGWSLFVVLSLIVGGVGLSLVARRRQAPVVRHKRRNSGEETSFLPSQNGGGGREGGDSSAFV